MARRELPPVPENPEKSPPAMVVGEEVVRIPGLPGEPDLDARVRAPAHAKRAVVLCHPHPLYGDQDEFCELGEARTLAESLGASLEVFPGADHFFLKSRRKLAEAVVPAIAPEA
jgi:alpha/beta superfamily hydrolase